MAERSPRMLDVANRLIEKTDAGEVAWTVHRTNPDYFQTAVGESVISVASADSDGNHPFVLMLWERNSKPLDENLEWLPIEKLSTGDTVRGFPPNWVNNIAKLWRVARNNALQIDSKIVNVLAALE